MPHPPRGRPEISEPTVGIDRTRILEQARNLSFPRYPGTEGDRKAIALVREALRSAGLTVTEEEFSYDLRPAWRALRSVLIACALLLGGAGWIALRFPIVAGALLLAAALIGGTLLAWAPALEKLYQREGPTRTANVVGRREGKAARMTLVLMAHHDSKSQNLTLPWRMGLTVVGVVGGVALIALVVVALFRGSIPGPVWLSPTAGTLAALAPLALATLKSGNHSPGAVDNAGSVGILLELARTLPAVVPDDVELVFLSTGAEEDHMVGAMRWLDRHRRELADGPVYTLNFDGAGNPGKVALLERYGFGKAFSRTLSQAARRAAARLGIPVRGVFMPPAMGLDTIPFAHRGLETMTFSSGSLGRGTLAVHSAGDRAENLDRETLGRVARLAAEVARELTRRSKSKRS